jgi:SAM-dependent methyltransferase
VSFTYINRLAALRAMEARQLITETVIRRPEFGGRSLRERRIMESNPSLTTDAAVKKSLLEAFEEISQEIRVLFDTESEYSLVFPDALALREVMILIAQQVSEQDWKEDDIIGWVYQYYNEEARRDFRKTKKNPSADDIPVINQFYTTPWIVKFLVDNTLGRLWLEMYPDSKLRDICNYVIQLKSLPSRDRKKVREIKVLDPACGSGHFLVYAFDVLYHMYREDEPATPIAEVPQLILANNLFGIDIDLRAVQLAALGLYLKAKSYNPKIQIRDMKLVCADVRIIDGKRTSEFLERLEDDKDLQRIFVRVFEDVENAYEIGSLLKVKEPFEKLFAERKLRKPQARLEVVLRGQTELSQRGTVGQGRLVALAPAETKNHLAMALPKQRTIQEMMTLLTELESASIEAHDMGQLLFASEAAKSVGLLSLLSQTYDVVLMNPPYGKKMPSTTKQYLLQNYPETHIDYYAAFIEQALNLCEENAFLGMLTSRTYMFLKWFRPVRERLLSEVSRPEVVLDLGFNVLDEATGRWAAAMCRKNSVTRIRNGSCVFFRLTQFQDENSKRVAFERSLNRLQDSGEDTIIFIKPIDEFKQIPGASYAYWAPKSLIELFNNFPPLDRDVAQRQDQEKIADAKDGITSADDARFTRLSWEVESSDIGMGKRWIPYAKGGYRFYDDIDLVINWENEGRAVKANPTAVVRNKAFFFRPGLCWSLIASSIDLEMRILPAGVIFSHAAQGLFPSNPDYEFSLLGFCNSRLCTFLFCLLDPLLHNRVNGAVCHIPISEGVLNSKRLRSMADECYCLIREWDTGDEISALFTRPWMLQAYRQFDLNEIPATGHPFASQFKWAQWPSLDRIRSIHARPGATLGELAQLCLERDRILTKRVDELLKAIDEEVFAIYGISNSDQNRIERELNLIQALPVTNDEDTLKPSIGAPIPHTGLDIGEHVARLISFYVKRVIETDEDGIIPLNEQLPDNLIGRIRDQIISDFGKEALDKVEQEIEKALGKPLLDWLAEDFSEYHVALYKRRPIFWQLTSQKFGNHPKSVVFSCFLYYHKLSKDTLPKVQALYLYKVKETLKGEKERAYRELAKSSGNRAKELQHKSEHELLSDQLDELEKFESALNELIRPREVKTELSTKSKWIDRAIAEVRDNGWNPIIEHGVRVNIEPLKELSLLHRAADKVT